MNYKPSYNLLAALPAVIFISLVVLQNALMSGAPDWPLASELTGSQLANERTARQEVLTVSIVFLACGLSLLVYVGVDLHKCFKSREIKKLAWAALIIIAVAFAFFILRDDGSVQDGMTLKPASFFLGDAVFSKAFQLADSGTGLWGSRVKGVLDALLNVNAALIVLAIIVAGLSCLLPVSISDADEAWRYQSERLRRYLFMAGAVLAIGTYSHQTWTSYPAFVIEKVNQQGVATQEQFLALSSSLAAYLGIGFTLMLASFFLPLMFIQSAWANTLVVPSDTNAGKPQVLAATTEYHDASLLTLRRKRGLLISLDEAVKSIVAILAPLLTGTLSNLLTVASSG